MPCSTWLLRGLRGAIAGRRRDGSEASPACRVRLPLPLACRGDGVGVTLASSPLIERDIAEGWLVRPIAAAAWRALADRVSSGRYCG
jgi:hypothetical protein